MLFFNEWRAASRAASAAERLVSEAYMRYFDGTGTPPAPELVEDARRRRAVANDLFAVALSKWHASGHRPGPLED